jgi:hypothetical protein
VSTSLLFRDYLSGLPQDEGYMIGLLTVTGDFAGSPARFNTLVDRSVVSRGDTYFPSGFDCTVPDRVSEGEQRTAIIIPAADRTLWSAVRTLTTQMTLVFEIIRSSDEDEVELGPYRMIDVSRSLSAEVQTLTIECSYRNVLRDPRPGKKFTPRGFPGMFARPDFSSLGL